MLSARCRVSPCWIVVLLGTLVIDTSARGQTPGIQLDLPKKAVSQRVSLTTRVPENSRKVFADLEGPGCIRHIWITDIREEDPSRNAIIRIYFDGDENPHVEAPLRDFFGVMHGKAWYPIDTPLISVQAKSGYNCYFAMPFAESARIEIEAGPKSHQVYMQVDWHQYPGQEMKEPRRFRAQWRREFPTRSYSDDYLMLDADGPGQLVGFAYGVRLIDNTDRWSHGGAENVYLDGEGEFPAFLRGIGGEDTFGTSYGGSIHVPESRLYASMPFYEQIDDGTARPAKLITGIRWFLEDSIEFDRSIHVRFGCMENDICSTVYWYQAGPARPFFRMPPPEQRAANRSDNTIPAGSHDLPLPTSGSWSVTGPIENEDNRSIEQAIEGSLDLDSEEVSWIVRQSHHGFLDFGHVFRPRRRGVGVYYYQDVAAARCTLQVPQDTQVTIRLAWDDHLVLRVNDQPPMDLGHRDNFGSSSITVPLNQGDNQIELVLSNTQNFNHGGWALAFLATLPDGTIVRPEAR